ncbi:NUDIX domain-containing protein [Neptunicella sp.]|uniref:NUDIX hydrolase n=1 Tax=Neptunicella sp. TaxID=2125986 RepID=UPI003F68D184
MDFLADGPFYCLTCGEKSLTCLDGKEFRCARCGFVYFHNVATAVAALIEVDDQLLLIRRARDPGKGLLGLPGGFVDPYETAEQALQREIEEEIGVTVGLSDLRYFASWPNQYRYRDVNYHTQDLYFRIKLTQRPLMRLQAEEVSEVVWWSKQELDIGQLAFCSARDALTRWGAE